MVFSFQSNRWKRQNFDRFLEIGEVDEYYGIDYVEPVDALQGEICDRSVQLLGPKSPLESEMYSVLMDNKSKRAISIDQHSVNHVLLTPLQQVSDFFGN